MSANWDVRAHMGIAKSRLGRTHCMESECGGIVVSPWVALPRGAAFPYAVGV